MTCCFGSAGVTDVEVLDAMRIRWGAKIEIGEFNLAVRYGVAKMERRRIPGQAKRDELIRVFRVLINDGSASPHLVEWLEASGGLESYVGSLCDIYCEVAAGGKSRSTKA